MPNRPVPPSPQRPGAENVAPEEIDAAVIRHGGFIEGVAALGLNYATAGRILLAAYGPARGGNGAARQALRRLIDLLGVERVAASIGEAPVAAVLAWSREAEIPSSARRAIEKTARSYGIVPRAKRPLVESRNSPRPQPADQPTHETDEGTKLRPVIEPRQRGRS